MAWVDRKKITKCLVGLKLPNPYVVVRGINNARTFDRLRVVIFAEMCVPLAVAFAGLARDHTGPACLSKTLRKC